MIYSRYLSQLTKQQYDYEINLPQFLDINDFNQWGEHTHAHTHICMHTSVVLLLGKCWGYHGLLDFIFQGFFLELSFFAFAGVSSPINYCCTLHLNQCPVVLEMMQSETIACKMLLVLCLISPYS